MGKKRKHRHFTLDDAHALKVGEGWRLSHVAADSTPGPAEQRQGRRHPSRAQGRRSAGRRSVLVREADRGGKAARLPPPTPHPHAQARPHRRVGPLALRGRAGGEGQGAHPLDEIEGRYDKIVEFENQLAAQGVHLIKVMLHIDPDEQYERLMERLDRDDKHWKFDVDDAKKKLEATK